MSFPSTCIQTFSGRAWDLMNPDPANVCFRFDIPEALARLCRYTGHVPGGVYSVAQHCVMGCDAIMEETGDAWLAACFLLHDAHESYLGDIVTPVALAMDQSHLHPGSVNRVIRDMKSSHDRAIFIRAGLPFPDKKLADAIHDWDTRMLGTERRQLLAAPATMPAAKLWGKGVVDARPIPLRGRIKIWPVARAADTYRERLELYCPNAFRDFKKAV